MTPIPGLSPAGSWKVIRMVQAKSILPITSANAGTPTSEISPSPSPKRVAAQIYPFGAAQAATLATRLPPITAGTRAPSGLGPLLFVRYDGPGDRYDRDEIVQAVIPHEQQRP